MQRDRIVSANIPDTIAQGEPHNKVYEIFDEHVHEVERDTVDYFNWGIVIEGETVEALAEKLGLDPAALRNTIDQYNAVSRGEMDDPYQRSIISPDGLSHGPYYAIEVYPGGTLSGGGLKVNEQMQVVKTDGDIFDGLYAVGEVSGGYRAFGYAGGDSLSHAAVSGKLAGEYVAEALKAN